MTQLPSVESLFGHMDRSDRAKIASMSREIIRFELRGALAIGRTGKFPEEEVDRGVAYIRQRAEQYDAIASWFENQ